MKATYLITGGTGSLGRELLLRLVHDDPGAEIALLVRAADQGEAREKWGEVSRYLHHYGSAASLLRVLPIVGDVELPSLGLAAWDAAWLRRRVTHIIHAAASIGLGQSLELARAVNVQGTHEVLRFAESCRRLERFAHVSTAYVAGDRSGTIRENELSAGQRFLNAYERSKFEAEELIQARSPDFTISIFRPGIIVGDSSDGHTCNFGTLYCPLKLIAKGALTRILGEPSTPLDIVPVDYVADCIVKLAADRRLGSAVYHVTAGREWSIEAGRLVETFARLHGEAPPRFVEFPARNQGNHGALAAFFSYLSGFKAFDDTALRRDLGANAPPHPDPQDYLANLDSFCESTDWGRVLPWERAEIGIAA